MESEFYSFLTGKYKTIWHYDYAHFQ
jgi:hypothetical protein